MDTYAEVTQTIVAALDKGVPPWRKPWGEAQPMFLPMNAKTKKPYQGINVMLLWLQAKPSPFWATKKTWQQLGATIAEESPTEIYFYTFFAKGEKRLPFLRAYDVYNLSQVLGCDHLRKTNNVIDYAPADAVISMSKAKFVVSRNACYDPLEDIICFPEKSQFVSTAAYYTTKLHELSHWTGHRSRLNRTFNNNRQSKEYAYEELIAELASCFLAASLQIPEALSEMPNHASYLAEWLSILKEDTRAIFRAASAAQKVTRYLHRKAS